MKDDKLGHSHLGQAVVLDPKVFVKNTEDKLNYLIVARTDLFSVSYWAGFGWDKSGQFADYDSWKTYVDQFAQGTASPIVVTVSAD